MSAAEITRELEAKAELKQLVDKTLAWWEKEKQRECCCTDLFYPRMPEHVELAERLAQKGRK
jgi:hypothetical protein